MSMIFTTHNILRQRQNTTETTNMQKKSSANEFPIQFKGKTYTYTRKEVEETWLYILDNNGLK